MCARVDISHTTLHQHELTWILSTHLEKGAFPGCRMPYIHKPTVYGNLHNNIQSASPDLDVEAAPNNSPLPAYTWGK